MTDFEPSEQSRGEIIAIERLAAEPARMGVTLWRDLAANRRYPARPEFTPQMLGALCSNIVAIRILDGGADYECTQVGDVLARAFNEDFVHRRLSAIIAEEPKFGLGLRMLFEMVRAGGEPLGYRGWVGRDMKNAKFVYHESALLPFGPDETVVDHLVFVSAIVTRRDAGA